MTQSNDITTPPREAITPVGINHLVLNVRDLEESHAFWTEIMGFKQVGELHPRPDRPNPPKMRFYSGDHHGKMQHHDLALMEMPNLPPPSAWSMSDSQVAINHVAITLPSREAWLKQLAFLQSKGITFHRRINHGMTHSVYISDPNGYGIEVLYELPREVWEGDIDAALNYAEPLPTQGEAALVDAADHVPVFGKAS
jgi:catechol-2,3-dioxygenase